MRGLTVVNPGLERYEVETAPGMAFWAGTGPTGAKCGQCVFYGYRYIRPNGQESKRNGCAEFYRMTGKVGDALSRTQVGCKYFKGAGHEETKEKGSPG